MARLNVKAAVLWTGGQPDQVVGSGPTFQLVPMLMVLSVTDQEGAVVQTLTADSIHVNGQVLPDPTEGSGGLSISDFHRFGPTFGPNLGSNWYSFVINPPQPGWLGDQVLLCVTVKHTLPGGGFDHGQDVLLATYHLFH